MNSSCDLLSLGLYRFSSPIVDIRFPLNIKQVCPLAYELNFKTPFSTIIVVCREDGRVFRQCKQWLVNWSIELSGVALLKVSPPTAADQQTITSEDKRSFGTVVGNATACVTWTDVALVMNAGDGDDDRLPTWSAQNVKLNTIAALNCGYCGCGYSTI